MSDCSGVRLVSPLSDFLSAETDRPEGTHAGYFCRTCGTTLDAHQATCPDCGSHMLEPTPETTAGSD